jgi:plastocyanin
MRIRRHYLPLATLLGVAVAMIPAIANSAVTATVNAESNTTTCGTYTNCWSPTHATVMSGDMVAFNNSSGVMHGVVWQSGNPATPACTNVPVNSSSASFNGTCKFSQAGTYNFYCYVHGASMSGTITVNSNGEPTVTTESATSVTEHEATLEGTVNPNGKATEYFFKWGTTASYGHETSTKSAGAGTTGVPVSETLTGLTQGTTYHFRLVAKNETGTAEGADQTFTTASPPPPPGPPIATTGEATSVSETEATLNGTVNPDGEATKYFFKWGTTTGYGQTTGSLPVAGEDHVSHPALAVLKGLVPGTTYHFQLVAENKSGTVPGADRMFTTKSPSSPPSEPPPPTTTTTTASPLPPTTTTHAEPPPGPPIVGSPSLRSTQHGTSVKGLLDVSQAGAGGRLEVDLLAKGASLAAVHRSSQVRVGRLVRASVSAGKVSFSVALTARAKSALRRHHRLALTVKITLTPTHGTAVSIARSVTLRS